MSKKLTEYVVKTGIVPVESYEIYQYGFQIGLEMLFSFVVCFGVATYLHMIPEFVVYTGIFMLLRTYAAGGYDVEVKDTLLVEVLKPLTERKRDVILLHNL